MSTASVINAVVFTPSADAIEATARCLEHCKTRGYHMVGVVVADWPAVEAMLDNGKADLMVADSPSDLPVGPRFEFVSHSHVVSRPNSRRSERTRMIRRSAAE